MQTRKIPPLWLLMLLICFPQLSETIYTPSLPDLASDLSVSNSLAQWTLSIYFIGFALGVAFWGNYSDSIGRKPAILRGILLYFCACIACYFSKSITYLLIFRGVQAFGISVGSVVVQSILREVFQGNKRNVAFSRITIVMAFSPALGPFIGGITVNWFGWQSNFLILSLLIAVVFILCIRFLSETCQNIQNKNNIYELIKLSFQMFTNAKIMTFAMLTALFNGIMFSYYSHAPFIFINLLNFSEKQYGMFGLLIAIGVFSGSLLSLKLNKHWHSEKIIQLGCMGCFFSIVLLNILIFLGNISSLRGVFLILCPMLLFFVFFSIAIPSLLGTALHGFEARIGAASSIFGCSYYILTAIFNFFMGMLDNKTITVMPLYFLFLSYLILGSFMFYRLFIKKTIIGNESNI